MKPYIKDERTGLAYELIGDYYLPAGEDDLPPLSVWGRRRLAYLKAHCRDLYADLLLSGMHEQSPVQAVFCRCLSVRSVE